MMGIAIIVVERIVVILQQIALVKLVKGVAQLLINVRPIVETEFVKQARQVFVRRTANGVEMAFVTQVRRRIVSLVK
jgi:hypothetical protein